MRGFIAGTLFLIVLETVTEHGVADKASTGMGLLAGGIRRLLAADVAGIPNIAPKQTKAKIVQTNIGRTQTKTVKTV